MPRFDPISAGSLTFEPVRRQVVLSTAPSVPAAAAEAPLAIFTTGDDGVLREVAPGGTAPGKPLRDPTARRRFVIPPNEIVALAAQETRHSPPRHALGTVAVNVNSLLPSRESEREGRKRKKIPCSRSIVPLANTKSLAAICL